MATHLHLASTAPLLSLVLAVACGAEPQADKPGNFPGTGQSVYPSVATCTQLKTGKPPFATDAPLGAPDAAKHTTSNPTLLDMQACPTLDLTWTNGSVLDDNAKGSGLDDMKADIRLYVPRVAGRTRVEASQDGSVFTVVGFLGSAPTSYSGGKCLLSGPAGEALVYLSKCNTINNVHHLRLTRDINITGSLILDAVEAIHFKDTK